jgi:hypothetical protein
MQLQISLTESGLRRSANESTTLELSPIRLLNGSADNLLSQMIPVGHH